MAFLMYTEGKKNHTSSTIMYVQMVKAHMKYYYVVILTQKPCMTLIEKITISYALYCTYYPEKKFALLKASRNTIIKIINFSAMKNL